MMRTENMMTLKFEDVMMSWKAVWWPPVPRRPVWDYITPDSYTGNSLCVCRDLHLQLFGWMGQFSNLCCLAWMFTPLQYVYVSRGALTIPSWSPGCLAGPGRPQLWNRALHLVPAITHSLAKKFPDSGAEGPGEPTAGNWPHIWPNFALLGRFWWCWCWCWHYCCFRLTQLRQKRSQFRS